MNKILVVMAVLALLCLGVVAQADVFNLGAGFTNLETVAVGDAGNIADTRYITLSYGSVGYNYNIGKYEVTAKQYTDFLNAKAQTDKYGLYNGSMWSAYGCQIRRNGEPGSYSYTVADDWANRPVNYVSYWDACRFTNWLSNGQGDGDTETGTYTLNGYNDWDGRTIGRNAGAIWAVTSEDEWYKAAYYKGGTTAADYWKYPTRSYTIPANQVLPTDPGNSANYYINDYSIGSPYYLTNVGEFENSASTYGTFDQGGNVTEWNEAVHINSINCVCRGIRGSSFRYYYYDLQAGSRGEWMPAKEENFIGFRVVLLQPVPEPSSILAMISGLAGLGGIALRRRR